MEPFELLKGVVAPLDRAHVDTDAIIPKQYLKSVHRTGFGAVLFDNWRYLDPGEPGMDHSTRRIDTGFVLNHDRYQGAQILLARENFGCGSSREHAVWALDNYGFRAILAPSFADIFFNNCHKNGLLPIVLDHGVMDYLFGEVHANHGYELTIDLEAQVVRTDTGDLFEFEMDGYRKHRLIHGLDDIALTLQRENDIRSYEARRRQEAPWLFGAVDHEGLEDG